MAAALEPAQARGFLDERPPLAGDDARIASTLPWPTTAAAPGPRPTSGEQLDDVGPPHGRPVDEVLPFAAAVETAGDRDLLEVDSRQGAADVLEAQLDLAVRAGWRPAEPAKSTSSGFSARSSLGARLPEAQSSASAMFDLPDPLGPTTTATPGSRRTSTGSGNDLKPRMVIARRYTAAQR